MVLIRCVCCKRWCTIEGDTRYCAGCGKPLDVATFQVQLRRDAAMVRAYNANERLYHRAFPLSLLIFFFGSWFLEYLGGPEHWAALVGASTALVVWVAIYYHVHHRERRIRRVYRRLGSMPETFRPTFFP